MSRAKMVRSEYVANARLIARRGSECGQSKLDEATVAMIKRQHARKQRLVRKLHDMYGIEAIAKRFGVHARTIEKVLQRDSWIHVREELL